MPAPRRGRRPGRVLPLLAVLLAVALMWLGPRLVRAHSALQWTRYHTAQPPDAFGQHARAAARWSTEVLAEAAPLPWGSAACRLALDYGGREESVNPVAALLLYERVRAALENTTTTRWRGFGLGGLLEEARQREQALRTRPDIIQ
jgi:hypothetical protein